MSQLGLTVWCGNDRSILSEYSILVKFSKFHADFGFNNCSVARDPAAIIVFVVVYAVLGIVSAMMYSGLVIGAVHKLSVQMIQI